MQAGLSDRRIESERSQESQPGSWGTCFPASLPLPRFCSFGDSGLHSELTASASWPALGPALALTPSQSPAPTGLSSGWGWGGGLDLGPGASTGSCGLCSRLPLHQPLAAPRARAADGGAGSCGRRCCRWAGSQGKHCQASLRSGSNSQGDPNPNHR